MARDVSAQLHLVNAQGDIDMIYYSEFGLSDYHFVQGNYDSSMAQYVGQGM